MDLGDKILEKVLGQIGSFYLKILNKERQSSWAHQKHFLILIGVLVPSGPRSYHLSLGFSSKERRLADVTVGYNTSFFLWLQA